MSKYRFKTKDEFIRDGRWDDEHNVPLYWNWKGDMSDFLGKDVPLNLVEKCEKGLPIEIDGWKFNTEDYVLKEELNTNGFEYFGDTLMEVSMSGIDWYPRVVFGKKEDKFIVWGCARDIESAKSACDAVPWDYARPIKTKITIQEVADKFELDVNEIEII